MYLTSKIMYNLVIDANPIEVMRLSKILLDIKQKDKIKFHVDNYRFVSGFVEKQQAEDLRNILQQKHNIMAAFNILKT